MSGAIGQSRPSGPARVDRLGEDGRAGGTAREDGLLLEVRGLRKFFPIRRGLLRRLAGHVRAVDDVSFELRRGETLSLVGESGCGKTTTSRCILRAITPTAGEILFRTSQGQVVDVATLPKRRLRPLRREMQMIFQDPFSSLNPRKTLHDIVGEPLLVNGVGSRRERSDRVAELLRLVGLRPEYMRRFPHAFSGGQRQRIGIARALALNPSLVVADEPVSALDVSVQAQILNLMLDLQSELGLTYLFVAHDLSVVKHVSDRVAVMYVGRIVEVADTERLFATPRHPYTEALLSAVPEARPPAPDPAHRPRGGRGRSGEPAVGLLLPSAVRVRGGDVPDREAAPGSDRAGPRRRLPPGARAHPPRRRRLVRAPAGARACATSGRARPDDAPALAALAASQPAPSPAVGPPADDHAGRGALDRVRGPRSAAPPGLPARGRRHRRRRQPERDRARRLPERLPRLLRLRASRWPGPDGRGPRGWCCVAPSDGSGSTAWRRTSSRGTAPRAPSCAGSGSDRRGSRPAI